MASAANASSLALNACHFSYETVTAGTVGFWLLRYVFPLQLLVGVSGNSLNLLLLLSRVMRSRTNCMFAALALADLLFLLIMVPLALGTLPGLAHSPTFYAVYHRIRGHNMAFANCFSTASIWLALAITSERLHAIRKPLTHSASRRTPLWRLLVAIFAGSLVVSAYHHFGYRAVRHSLCNGSAFYIEQVSVNPALLNAFTVANALLVVVAPLLGLLLLNGLLVNALHRQMHATRQRRSTGSFRLRSTERKVSTMVVLIVSCFIVTHLPSALAAVVLIVRRWQWSAGLATVVAVTNSLVVTGKTLNFFLFCSSSSSFRRSLYLKLKNPGFSATGAGSRQQTMSSVAGRSDDRRRSSALSQLGVNVGVLALQTAPTDTLVELVVSSQRPSISANSNSIQV